MAKIRALLVGNGGRESSLAWRLAESCSVFAVSRHANPSLVRLARLSGGIIHIGDYTNPQEVASIARENNIDLALVANDEALASGVVDGLLNIGITTVGPTRAGAEIEWNKAFARRLLSRHLPQLNPEHWIVTSESEIRTLFSSLKVAKKPIVVKPQGLTAGRGVKVMGKHLTTFDDAAAYALKILKTKIGQSTEVIIEERLEGIEFTIQAITDGQHVLLVPATYDFPYRYDGDVGPGTGGMGSFAGPNKPLPFLSEEEYAECISVIRKVISILRDQNLHFNGALTASFFVTNLGLRIMEFNARFGEPECINLMSLLKTPLLEICDGIVQHRLDESREHFEKSASVVKYLVPPEYCLAIQNTQRHLFDLDIEKIEATGANVFFAAAEHSENRFQSISTSRSVAIEAKQSGLSAAGQLVETCIERHYRGPLEHRRDIGSSSYVEGLVRRRGQSPSPRITA